MKEAETQNCRFRRNVRNAILSFCVPIPSIVFYTSFLRSTHHHKLPEDDSFSEAVAGGWAGICNWSYAHPIGLLNVLFFLNVDVLFWIISLVQKSTWLIDPYWTILPLLMAHFFASHPQSVADPWRSRVVIALTWVWSARLTHSYFRRENWQWGEREDWRFAKMRTENVKHWWWLSFFIVYVSQHCFLVGICLPIYTVHNSKTPFNNWDVIVSMICILGMTIGYISDTQLYNFVRQNSIQKQNRTAPVPVLDEGIWHFSRHPNYFGEQLWWWGLAGYSWIVRQGWATVGTVINSAVLAQVTVLVEERMVADPSRREEYKKYQEITSVWIPLPKFKSKQKLQ